MSSGSLMTRAPLGSVDHDHLFVHVYLGGGQTDAGRRIHGLGHVGDQLLQRFIEYSDRHGKLVQPGVRVAEDV